MAETLSFSLEFLFQFAYNHMLQVNDLGVDRGFHCGEHSCEKDKLRKI